VDGHGVRLHDDRDDGHVLAQLSHVAAADDQVEAKSKAAVGDKAVSSKRE
jgi:hypothetical protein